ncbi:TetR/AcrR family transcriptional regulator [Bacillus sp. AFS015802]|uniref:TetR/AcrR family transcriptional regulator n=1 Tax=Bacillus sp. AFS015802 TaxID=2033486 RepID=UPI00211D3B8A|nr:TetR family transcriptional regulator [Bacillus sp. AFS015802]
MAALPKTTFFNLREEKRNVLVEAAKKEFSRVSLYEASIANILKTAGIPRGSFYQYFENKEDAFFYLVGEHARKRFETFISLLGAHEGDLFEATRIMFHSMLEFSYENGQNNFIRNVLLNMNYKIEKTFTQTLTRKTIDERYEEIFRLVNRDLFNIENKKDLYHVLQILSAVTFHNLVQSISDELTLDEAMEKYVKEMNMIKRGLCKSP